jgi:Cu-Zn family superoxide dismutase
MQAVAYFSKQEKLNKVGIEGYILFEQLNPRDYTTVFINLHGFKPNATHAIHIHESADFSNGCMSAGGHYNPFGKKHGSYLHHGNERHAGDLINNITSDSQGRVQIFFKDNLVFLYPPYSVIGRSVIIHEEKDDLGLGGDVQSLITGNAGGRMACAVIEHQIV